MSGLQTIIDNANSIQIDQRKVAGRTISRSGRGLTSEVVTAQPFTITAIMHQGLRYSTNRALLAELDEMDVTVEQTVDIGGTNSGLSFVTNWQGDSTAIGSVTVNAATGTGGANIYLNCSGAGTGTYLFKKGDFIQPASGYRYPYIVTADVPHSTSSNVTVAVHRPVIPQESYTFSGKSINIGNNVDWRVKLTRKPAYTIVPNDRIVFTPERIEMIEIVRPGDA